MEQIERRAINLAIGRILRLGSRPEQPGDVAEYERCRSLIFDLVECPPDDRPNYARDWNRGAQGD